MGESRLEVDTETAPCALDEVIVLAGLDVPVDEEGEHVPDSCVHADASESRIAPVDGRRNNESRAAAAEEAAGDIVTVIEIFMLPGCARLHIERPVAETMTVIGLYAHS